MTALRPTSLPFACTSPRAITAPYPARTVWRTPSAPATHPSPATTRKSCP
jgi:hypothetical protein